MINFLKVWCFLAMSVFCFSLSSSAFAMENYEEIPEKPSKKITNSQSSAMEIKDEHLSKSQKKYSKKKKPSNKSIININIKEEKSDGLHTLQIQEKEILKLEEKENNRTIPYKQLVEHFTHIPPNIGNNNISLSLDINKADTNWHQKINPYVFQNHKELATLVEEGTDPYNVAVFKVRFFWSDATNTSSELQPTEWDYSDLLFLSKMSLKHLAQKLGLLNNSNKADILNKAKNNGVLKNVKNLFCFGEFFKSSLEEPVKKRFLARQWIAELFEFKEKTFKNGHTLRKQNTKDFKSELMQQAKMSVSETKIPCQIYENSLYGLLPFDQDSNLKAEQYFNPTKKPLSIHSVTDAFIEFERNFADSEQGIFQFLLRPFPNTLKKPQQASVLKHVIVDICSYRPMCEFCTGTAQCLLDRQFLTNAFKGFFQQNEMPTLAFWVSYVKDYK